jgi:hypothetical protein
MLVLSGSVKMPSFVALAMTSTFLEGSPPEDIVDQFPTLDLADVYDVIAYYLRHRQDLDAYLADRERTYETEADATKTAFGGGIRTRAHLLRRGPR